MLFCLAVKNFIQHCNLMLNLKVVDHSNSKIRITIMGCKFRGLLDNLLIIREITRNVLMNYSNLPTGELT